MVVGCKSDTIGTASSSSQAAASTTTGVDRLKRMTINAKVLNELKKIDEGSQIDYLEAGLSFHRGVYKVPQDDLQLYICKLYEDALPLIDDSDEMH